MLLPARVKHRKLHRGRRSGVATQGADLAFGEFGLQASEAAWMTNRQIEAAPRGVARHLRPGGPGFLPGFPPKAGTKKPAEAPTGGGEGAAQGWGGGMQAGAGVFEK